MAQHRYLAAPTYLVAFSLCIIPPFDSLTTVFPFRFGDARWRFGAFGLLSNAMMLSLAGLLIAMVATAVFDQPRFRRVLGVIAGLIAVGLAAGWVAFALDALQVRNGVIPSAANAFKIASATAATKALVALATLIAMTLAAFRGPRIHTASKSSRGGLIVGGRSSHAIPASAPTGQAE